MRKIRLLAIVFVLLILIGGFLYLYSRINSTAILGTSTSKNANKNDLDSLKEKAGQDAQYSVDRNTGKITFLSRKTEALPFRLEKMAKSDPSAAAGQFMKEYGEYFGLENSDKELKLLEKKKDNMGMNHVLYNQVYRDVPVFGAQALVHVKKDLSVSSANGKFVPDISLDTDPNLSQKDAEGKAGEFWKKQFDGAEYEVKKTILYVFNKSLAENKKDEKNYLTWQVELLNKNQKKHEFYFINAENGELIFQITGIKNAIHRHVYDCSTGICYLDYLYLGYYGMGRSEGQAVRGANPIYGGTDVDDLYDVTSSMHDYLSSKFSRNGGNNLGGIGDGVYSATANTDSFSYIDTMYWTDCPNAFFSGYDINFCKGLVVTDVVGHEYGHGIVSFSVPGDLTYYGQSGALNEGFADMFGEALENYRDGNNDWLAGADVNVGGLVGPLRNLQDPTVLSDPDRFFSPNYYCGSSDYAGVHTNSTVMGHAAYLMAMGGTFNGCAISGIGKDKEERIFYRALTTYFTSNMDFNGAYNAFNQACNDLYGSGSSECLETKKALQSVEMDQGGLCSGEARVQPCSPTPPEVSGVTDGATYNTSVTITFNKGEATLNGASFSSGSVVSEEGSYTLTVTDTINSISTTVNFSISKFSTNTPTLPRSVSKKAKRTINATFHERTISTKKKWVTARLGGRRVKVTKIRTSGGNFSIWINFSYRKWPIGNYTLAVSHKRKVGKSWQKGSLVKENALSIN